MSTNTFANGETLTSSALTPQAVLAIFQRIVAQILGFDPDDPDQQAAAWSAVRVAWQREGQPAWGIDEDICILQASPENDPFSRVRDSVYESNDATSLTRHMAYTQIWKLQFTLYGPNAEDHARLIVSAMSLEWVHDAFDANNLYAVPDWSRPVYAPELFQGRWWQRTDVELRFNELVTELLTAPSAAGVDVTLIKDTGLSAEIHIGIPQ